MSKTILPMLGVIAALVSACGGGSSTTVLPYDQYDGIAIADLNNDGLPDIAIAYHQNYSVRSYIGYVRVFLQNPSAPGSFQAPTSYQVGNHPWALKIADLNADTLPDIIVVNSGSNSVSILYQQTGSPGSFATARDFPTTIQPSGLVIKDINNDGLPDIAVSGFGGSVAPGAGAAILLQDTGAAGSFLAPIVVTTGTNAEAIAAEDVNNDGTVDLVVDGDTDIRLLRQDPANPMTFDPPVSLIAGIHPAYVMLADFDQDGHVDILVANAGSYYDGSGSGISFLRQNPLQAGQFLAPIQFATARGARSFVVQDLNGDGSPDLAVATVVLQSPWPGAVSVLLQNPGSPGTILSRVDYRAGYTPYFIDAGDLNNDTYPDLAVTDEPVILFQNPVQLGAFTPAVNLLP